MDPIVKKELIKVACVLSPIVIYLSVEFFLTEGPVPFRHPYPQITSNSADEAIRRGAYIWTYDATIQYCDTASSTDSLPNILVPDETFAEFCLHYPDFGPTPFVSDTTSEIVIRYSRYNPNVECLDKTTGISFMSGKATGSFQGLPPDSLIIKIEYENYPAELILRKKKAPVPINSKFPSEFNIVYSDSLGSSEKPAPLFFINTN